MHPSKLYSLVAGLTSVLPLAAGVPCPSNTTDILADPLHMTYYPPAADCQDYMIPVDVTYDELQLAAIWNNNFDLVNFLTDVTTRKGANLPSPFGAAKPINTTYQIAATFCTPKHKIGNEKTVLLATHGIGPGREHWNPSFEPENYNFVQYAIDQGYSIFFYDRLGCGASQKVSGYTAQINTAIAVLQGLAKLVRGGQYTGAIGKPDKLALIGFSFGSYTTHGAISLTPDIADAVVLTAIGFNDTGLNPNGLVRSFEPRIAALQNPDRFGDRDFGYATWADKFGLIWNYFKSPAYDPLAALYVESTKQPFAIAEFLTFLSGPMDSSNFTGAALHITGEKDYIVCDGDCVGIYDEPSSSLYRNAKLELAIHPAASHHINFHYNATGAFEVITSFLGRNGM